MRLYTDHRYKEKLYIDDTETNNAAPDAYEYVFIYCVYTYRCRYRHTTTYIR